MRRNIADTLALLSIMALTGLFAWGFVNFSLPPFEDAAMLMRYADHVAQGKGIVWNIGEPPVDGATDFLFMVFVAVLRRFGFHLETAVRLITISAHFGTVGLIYVGMRRLQRSGIIPAFLSAAYFAVGPGLFLAAAYFGTPFFALAVTIAWILAQRLIFSNDISVCGYFLFSLACLTVGLIRPEGVLIGVFMLTAVGVVIPLRDFRQLAIIFGIVFLVLGGTYFIWRWNYFGYPLPNPFYKKGGGYFYFSALEGSVINSFNLLYPFIPAFMLSVRRADIFRMGITFLIPIAGSVAMWVLLSNEMDFGTRFQYPVLAIGALSWFPLIKTLQNDLSLPKFASFSRMQKLAVVLAIASVLGVVFEQQVSKSVHIASYGRYGQYDVAIMLSEYADGGYTIATTEAGLLPLYSKWRAIDTWGLNDQWIAHNGLITEEYLDNKRPDIIMFHEYPSLTIERYNPLWSRQVHVLQNYAELHNFTLAAVFGIRSLDTHSYYVRSDLPKHNEIVQRIRSTYYNWVDKNVNGGTSNNYVDLCGPLKHMPGAQ